MKSAKYYTIPEIVQTYKVSYRSIWNWIQAKELKAIKVKRMIRVSRESLEELIER